MANYRLKIAEDLGLDYLSITVMSDAITRGYCKRLGFVTHNLMAPYYSKLANN